MNRFLAFFRSGWIVVTTATLAAITVLSLWSPDTMPETPGSDKIHHFIAYAFLALPTALRKPRRWMLICLGFIAYSGIIEVVQPLTNRCCDGMDLLTNSLGVLCGAIVALVINAFYPETAVRRA